MIISSGGGGETLNYLLAAGGTRVVASAVVALLALAALQTAQAADNDLGGGTQSITSDSLKGNTWRNGTLNVSANQNFNDATTTLGSGLTVNQTAGMWGISGNGTLNIEGAVVNYTSTSVPYFIKRSNGTTYGGTTQITIDNGTFSTTQTEIKFTAMAGTKVGNNYVDNRDVVAKLTMKNNSSLAAPSDKDIIFGGMEQANSKKHKTLNVTVSVTDSAITAKQIVFGQTSSYLSTPASSANNITFGSGATLNLYHQLYAYPYPAPTIKFNGATVNYLGGDATISFIGQNTGVTTDIYEIQSGGLTIDIPSGKSVTTDSNTSALKGSGGVTKTGGGSMTWNTITSKSPSGKMTFTGPLVVSNGTWTSTKEYAASAFKANGGTLVLSGALSAVNVSLEATDGGTLTLAGAAITDSSPDLTLAGGGTTDYFTRDNAVGTYTLNSLTLGPGAVLDLDANAMTGCDKVNATTLTVTATAESKVAINIKLATGASPKILRILEIDEADADKFSVVIKQGDTVLPSAMAWENGSLSCWIGYTWNGSGTNWGDAGAWNESSNWADDENAIFNIDGASAVVAEAVTAGSVAFIEGAAVSGSAALTVPEVYVADGKAATISATTSGDLAKSGIGTLTLSQNRTAQTTVEEGTLVMSGATVDPSKLTLGTDAAKPVVFDYGAQTLTANPTAYLGGDTDITLTNGSYVCSAEVCIYDPNFPSVLTVASDATFQTDDRFCWGTSGDATINIAGGTVKSVAKKNNWIMQASKNGKLNINVTDGGLLEFGGEAYMLTCRDGSDDYQSPELRVKVVDSTVRVNNGQSLRLGRDTNTKPSATPVLTFAATNSVIDIGYGIYVGNDKTGLATAGSYTADLVGCVVTAREMRVYQDRVLNNLNLDGTTMTLNTDNITCFETAGVDPKWITVGDGGFTLDTAGRNSTLNANFGGVGAVTKTGTGKLTIAKNQTSSAALVCEAGEIFLNAGLTVNRPVTVKDGATFTAQATAQSTVECLALEDGSTLNVDTPTAGVVPMSVTSLTLPGSGTVALKKDGGAFGKGCYGILSKAGITVADVDGKLVPQLGAGSSGEWLVKGDTLVLAVDMDTSGNVWTGLSGDGKMSTGGNWLSGTAPGAGDAIDFTGIASATTIEGDIDATFGAVTMGGFVVTFSGDKMKATSFSDTAKIAVGANSVVTLDNDLVFSNTVATNIVDTIATGGRFVVTGVIEHSSAATAELVPYNTYGGGAIVAKGLRANATSTDNWIFRFVRDQVEAVPWIIGSEGIGGSKRYWLFRNANHPQATIKPLDSDFEITTFIGVPTDNSGNYAVLNFNTTGDDGAAHTITIGSGAGFSGGGIVNIVGTGKVLADYTGNSDAKTPFNVKDTATLAINAGKQVSTGAITVNEGATLAVATSGTVKLAGNLTLNNGACLGFNFTNRDVDPELALALGKTLSFAEGAATNITVKVSGTVWPKGGEKVLTSCGGFNAGGVKVSLDVTDKPEWAKEVFVNADGNIVLTVQPRGLVFMVN